MVEYDALWTGCGLVELENWSSVSITGADRQVFLNKFCTNDVKRLKPGACCEAFFTNVKGKILGHGLISCRTNELVVVGVPNQSNRLIEHLDRYVIREDVRFRDTSAERAFVLVAGDQTQCAEKLLKHIELEMPRSDTHGSKEEFGGSIDDVPVYMMRWFATASWHTTMIEVSVNAVSRLCESLASNDIIACSKPSLDVRRIEAGLPLYGVDFDDNNLPQEAGRDSEAINFSKGCYLGQETVARIDAIGHVNQRIVGVRFFGEIVPDTGDELTRSAALVGRVSSAVVSPRLGAPLALAMVRKESVAVGTRMDSKSGACETVSLPIRN